MASQALETAIGMVLVFFVLALSASVLTEAVARTVNMRAKSLERTIKAMLGDDSKASDSPMTGDELRYHISRLDSWNATLVGLSYAGNSDAAAQREKVKHSLQRARDAQAAMQAYGTSNVRDAIAAAQRAYQDAEGRSKETGGQADENSDATDRRAAADIAALEGVLAERGEAVSWQLFTSTSVYRTLKDASTHHLWKDERPSYMSAKAFADAVWEMVGKLDDPGAVNLPGPLGDRVRALHAEAEAEALKIKAGLERWFDDTMDRLSGAYKRWSTLCVFIAGLGLTVAANASAYHLADALWHDPVTRAAVVAVAEDTVNRNTTTTTATTTTAAAESSATASTDSTAVPSSDNDATAQTVAPSVPDSSSTTSTTTNPVEEIAKIADDLQQTSLPLGWSKQFRFDPLSLSALTHAVGWLVTATLITLGAPFWFDLLSRLVSLRGTGGKPAPAAEDDDSATARVVAKPKP